MLQVEEVKLSPGHMYYSYSTVYTSISGLRFSSNGVTQSYHDGVHTRYYSLSRMCDGDLKNAYIVTSSYTNVVITVSLPRIMFIHHIRLYPVCITPSFVLSICPKINYLKSTNSTVTFGILFETFHLNSFLLVTPRLNSKRSREN